MTNINITNLRKNIYKLLEDAVEYNETINVSTKKGNVVILSEEDYNGLIETLYLSSIPDLKDDIIKGLKEDIDDCVDEEEVEW